MSVYTNGKFYSTAFKNGNNLKVGELKFISPSSNLSSNSSNVVKTSEDEEKREVDKD